MMNGSINIRFINQVPWLCTLHALCNHTLELHIRFWCFLDHTILNNITEYLSRRHTTRLSDGYTPLCLSCNKPATRARISDLPSLRLTYSYLAAADTLRPIFSRRCLFLSVSKQDCMQQSPLGGRYFFRSSKTTFFFISVINQPDSQHFCFTISLFHVSTCFEHMCSKHVETWNKLIVK